ncbi:MAG TPA: ABA4-like family protein [Bryobacteraceae bacterium]|nr:ABA4-like family protein [Bryobacteraceae bacterium]
MPAESIFSICSFAVVPGWLLLVIAPRWRWTQRVAAVALPVALPLALAAVYLTLIVIHFGKTEGGFGSLAQVAKLFANPYALLAGWIHYLVFDLFIGSWEVRDSERLRIKHAFVVPCLVLTFLFGPAGLLMWFSIRTSVRGRAAIA